MGSGIRERLERTAGRRGGGRLLGLALVVATVVTGCDLLDVEDNPATIDAEDIGGPASFQARFVGASSDFAAALDDAVTYGGLFTDELTWGGSFVARQEIDLRDVPSSNDIAASEPYTTLQTSAGTSRAMVEEIAAGNFEDQVSNPEESAELARMALFAGYARVYLADLFCTLAFDGTGPELSSEEVWGQAVELFTRAVDADDAPDDVRSAALVGRARARLQLGQDDGALSDAGQVAAGFEFFVSYSGVSAREENDVNGLTWQAERLSTSEEFRDLTLEDGTTPDPRVDLLFTGSTGFSGGVLQYNPVKHGSRTSPIRLASWHEAQYIIGEIQGGAEARDRINAVRAAQGLPEWDPDESATDQEIRDKLIDERSRTLFLEGQRMSDLRRYVDRFGLDLFPSGPDAGDQTCMPLPDLERDNNPDI
jgi:hypothetical protein